MRFRLALLAVGAAFFSTPAYALADLLPSFPDSAARETRPLLALGLLFVVVTSGASAMFLRELARTGTDEAQDDSATTDGPVQPEESVERHAE